MKVQLESITDQMHRSFSMMVNPRLSDLFFWHSHPEYELVYITGATGTRHVGEHISTYDGSDLVLIGANIPHLNFDYGVQSDYRKVVIHLKKAFVENQFAHAPELLDIQRLFERSQYGIAFTGSRKTEIGETLFELDSLPAFDQYQLLLKILNDLSQAADFILLHDHPYLNNFNNKSHERIQSIYAFVDKNYHRKIKLEEVAQLSFMTKEAFCRYFKKTTTYSFTNFLNRYRISHAKRYLMSGDTVSEACHKAGFESLSYFNRVFNKITGENPRVFRGRYG